MSASSKPSRTDLGEYDAVVAKVEAAITKASSSSSDQLVCRSGCDSCCTAGLSVLPVEAASLRRFVDDNGAPQFVAKGAGWCTFLDVDGRCAVYSARPLLCRTHGLPMTTTEKRGSLRVLTDDVTVCALNFNTRAPTAAETLDASAILKLLVVVDRRYRAAAGLPDDTARVPLETLRKKRG
ncbi:MAG: YkgJ family cysteine cluster protein [Deltaproteobacteria bacterium]|nr:YkgJ family cysteine cluster protein [Deltaproteobacteria bacterium]